MPKKHILLIHPPIAKPCEPPAGLAKLAGALKEAGVTVRIYDASVRGIQGLVRAPVPAEDTWTRRAVAGSAANLGALTNPALYKNRDRYKRAVMDTNRILSMAGRPHGASLTLANYAASTLNPVRTADLLRSAAEFASNPFYPVFGRDLEARFHSQTPDLIGVSINFLSQALCAFAMIGFVRQRLPGVKLVCGGGLVTSWMKIHDKLGDRFAGLVDEWIPGPGERRMIALARGNAKGHCGITGYDYGEFDAAAYLAPTPILPYAASRGCYWKKCSFCPEAAEDAPYTTENARVIAGDLAQSAAATRAGLIHFLDNALSPRFMAHLIDHPPGVPWYGFVRITGHLTDPDFLRGLKASGCVMLKVGVESGDQAVLDALGKGIDIQRTERALAAIHRAGIATYVYLLFGTPAEDAAGARRTLDFTVRNAPTIDFLNLAIFNLPAHGRETADLDTQPFYRGDLSLYRDFCHPKGWNRDRVRRFLAKDFKKQPAVRSILANDPPFFTSNHAPFLVHSS